MDEKQPSRNPLRRLYHWTVGWAHKPGGWIALFFISLVEACIFPIPPDVLLIALAGAYPKRSLWFAFVCSIGSIIGGIVGYFIGLGLGTALLSEASIEKWRPTIEENAFMAVLVSAFTPLPYKVATILSGFLRVNFMIFLAATVIGRPARFFLVGVAIRIFGPKMQPMIEKHLEWVTIVLVIMLVGGYFAMAYLL